MREKKNRRGTDGNAREIHSKNTVWIGQWEV